MTIRQLEEPQEPSQQLAQAGSKLQALGRPEAEVLLRLWPEVARL